MKKVCLVIGAGAGIGGNCAKVFSRNGYYSFLTRRTDKIGLDKITSEIKAEKGEAGGKLINIVEDNTDIKYSKKFLSLTKMANASLIIKIWYY